MGAGAAAKKVRLRGGIAKQSAALFPGIWSKEPAVATILSGMETIDQIEEVGDTPPAGQGPSLARIIADPTFIDSFPGDYLSSWPNIDSWLSCVLDKAR